MPTVSSMEQTVRTWHAEGRSQRAIARDLNMDRRKVKQIIDQVAA
jgi:DNA-binding transcriptional regulator LsrR (DeoR family)